MNSKKKAIITGIQGQDGAFLANYLLTKGYKVFGADRRRVDPQSWRLKDLDIQNEIEFIYMDLLDYGSIHRALAEIMPDEIYNLGAQSFVKASFDQPMLTTDVDALGPLRILEAIRVIKPTIKFYQASTSEMFGEVLETPQTESTPFRPMSPYGCAKLFANEIVRNYRDSYNMFCVSGILFNHESEYRGIEFVTKKITNYVADYHLGNYDGALQLGNLQAKRDWGFAGDYVRAMHMMLDAKEPQDYVVSTGKTRTIKDFVEIAFKAVGIELRWDGEGLNERGINCANEETLVVINEKFYRPAEVDILLGNSNKIKKELGWEPLVSFDSLVRRMIDFDLKSKQ